MNLVRQAKERLKEEIAARLAEFPEVQRVVVFGSFVTSDDPPRPGHRRVSGFGRKLLSPGHEVPAVAPISREENSPGRHPHTAKRG